MQVILLERIGKLGQTGDEVTVKDGYARNYLLPRGKALRATRANRERFERERAEIETRNQQLKKEADELAKKLDGSTFTAIRQASEAGQLYGSVSTRDIAKLTAESGFNATRHQVLLNSPIKVLGLHQVQLSLHPEVEVTVTINVARSEEEAARQARGEAVTGEPVDEAAEEAAALAEEVFEEVFEDEELAKEAQEALHEAAEDDAAHAAGEAESHAGSEASNEDGPDTVGGADPDEEK